jgi:stearoyl-CoA desaturase (delta-9 desaturase)
VTTATPILQGSDLAWRRQRKVATFAILIPLLGTIAAGALAAARGVHPCAVWLLCVFYIGTGTGVEVGFHRLMCHRAFCTGPGTRIVLAILGSLALQGPVIFWVAVHRRHHMFSDRPGDPHSPYSHGGGLRGLWHSHVGWLFENSPTDSGRFAPDLLKERRMLAISMAYPSLVLASFALPTLLGACVDGVSGALDGLLWGACVRIFALQHVTWAVNSIGHVYGLKHHATRDRSKNSVMLLLPTLGASWHNDHHAFPTSARVGTRWWKVDVFYYLIRSLALLRLAWNIRQPRGERT